MISSYIEYVDYYLPDNTVNVKDILDESEISESKKNHILKCGNFDRICVEDRLNCYEMCEGLMQNCLTHYSGEKIKFLLFSGNARFVNNGISVPYYIVGKYNLKNTSIISINQGCASALHALKIADLLVKEDKDAKIIIASLWKAENYKERLVATTVIGDGACVKVVGSGSGMLKIIDSRSRSDGSTTLRRYLELGVADKVQPGFMDVEKNIVRNLKKLIFDLLRNNSLSIDDIALFIPQNVNHILYRLYAQNINVGIDRFFLENIPKHGHIGDADTAINLKDAISIGRIKHKDKIIMFSIGEVGGNFNYAAVLLECCN